MGKADSKPGCPPARLFLLKLPVSVANGVIDGDSSNVTIPTGRVESNVLTVSRRPGTTSAVTVDIIGLPPTPFGHSGYALVKSPSLPLRVLEPVPPVSEPNFSGLDFAHFANGASITSDLVLVNVAADPIRPAIYFFDKVGDLIAAGLVVDVRGDLEVKRTEL